MKTEPRLLADRYLLETPVASGGMAAVWRARDRVLDRPVAVKILHEGLAANTEILERFRREAVMAARLSHHGIVRVFDTGVDGETCYIVMEMLEGPSLADELGSAFPPADAVRIARGVLEGLAHAHGRGIVHRDVKPANIILEGRRVKVADFGIALAAFAGDITTTGDILGSVTYLAPEQIDGGEADDRSDLYAVGAVLYEMLTGRPPFSGETSLATASLRLTQAPARPGSLRAGIPRDLEAVVMRALARAPDERYESAAEMIAALDRCSVSAEHPSSAAPADDAPAPSFRSWALVPLLVVALGAAAVIAGLLVGRAELGSAPEVVAGDQDPSPAAAPIEIREARTHDPLGDGAEHDELVGSAIDGDPATAWHTEGYTTLDLGGAKEGVGLVLDLGRPASVAEVRIMTPSPGWTFELQGSADGVAFSEPFTDRSGATSFQAQAATAIPLRGAPFRYMLIWITGLVQIEDAYRATVAEVEVLGG